MRVSTSIIPTSRSSLPEVFLRKDILKICCKFTGEHPCRNAISIKLLLSGPIKLSPMSYNDRLIEVDFLGRAGFFTIFFPDRYLTIWEHLTKV